MTTEGLNACDNWLAPVRPLATPEDPGQVLGAGQALLVSKRIELDIG